MDLIEFFDSYNINHLIAYKYLTETGTWPEGFIPDKCILSNVWQYQLAAKMAVAYVNLGVAGKIPSILEESARMTKEEEDEIIRRGYF